MSDGGAAFNNRRWLGPIMLLLASISGASLAEEYKIGVINTDRILRESAPAKEAARHIEQEFQGRETAIAKQETELRDLVARAEREASTSAEETRNARQRDIDQRGREIGLLRQKLAEDLKTKQFDELTRLKERLDALLTRMAQEQGFDLILQDGVVYVGRGVDITDAVIKALETK